MVVLQLNNVYEIAVLFLSIKLWKRNIIKMQKKVVELIDLQGKRKRGRS